MGLIAVGRFCANLIPLTMINQYVVEVWALIAVHSPYDADTVEDNMVSMLKEMAASDGHLLVHEVNSYLLPELNGTPN